MRLSQRDGVSARRTGAWLALLVLWTAALLAGCSGGTDSSNGGTGIVINSPAAIAQESADDYNANVNGLITGATLKSWIANWPANRPAGITGKLIIFQATTGETGYEYLKPNNINVFVYLSPSSEWIQTRSNGVILTQSMVPDGPTMDALFKKYNIDPQHDMIVCAQGTGSYPNAMSQGRCWYALRYWGVDRTHLALLNGGNKWQVDSGAMVAGDFTATASTAPNSGTASVKDLKVDNTALQATLEDLLAILPASDTNVRTDGVLLWDARSLGQYSAGEKVELGEDTDPDTAGTQACASAYCTPTNTANYMWTFQNNGSRQGHPWGALQLQYTRLLDATQGYSYRPKAVLAAYLNGDVDANGIGFVDASYTPVGSGGAYQPGDTIYVYCETTFRAMITGIASGVVLGKPTRFYDGAMVEWNSLSHLQDATGNYILPSDSPWRTDVKSFFRPATSLSLVAQRTITDPYAVSANAIIRADKLYKLGTSGSGGGSGGSAPANPCG
jgi:thiosulfate/3-mercaptopyruvate sulfurtransferase